MMKSRHNTGGMFNHAHACIPKPFNPEFDPRAKGWWRDAIASMQAEGWYENHTRPENAAEFRRRYDVLKEAAGPITESVWAAYYKANDILLV